MEKSQKILLFILLFWGQKSQFLFKIINVFTKMRIFKWRLEHPTYDVLRIGIWKFNFFPQNICKCFLDVFWFLMLIVDVILIIGCTIDRNSNNWHLNRRIFEFEIFFVHFYQKYGMADVSLYQDSNRIELYFKIIIVQTYKSLLFAFFEEFSKIDC